MLSHTIGNNLDDWVCHTGEGGKGDFSLSITALESAGISTAKYLLKINVRLMMQKKQLSLRGRASTACLSISYIKSCMAP